MIIDEFEIESIKYTNQYKVHHFKIIENSFIIDDVPNFLGTRVRNYILTEKDKKDLIEYEGQE